MSIKTAFFGSSGYVLPILDALAKHTQLTLVVTQPDKPAGRGQEYTPSPPKKWAEENGVTVATPATLTPPITIEEDLKEMEVEVIIVADYGQIIPKEIFTLPRLGTINIHFSLLPDLRGPSPVQWTILRGDKQTGISYFLLEETLDTGPILSQERIPLSGDETTASLYTALFFEAAEHIITVIGNDSQGKITATPQNHGLATFTRQLTRTDGFVPIEVFLQAIKGNNTKSWQPDFIPSSSIPLSLLLERMLRAFTPWPGVWTEVGIRKLRLKILKAHVAGDKFVPDTVQLEGKKPVPWGQFILSPLYPGEG